MIIAIKFKISNLEFKIFNNKFKNINKTNSANKILE